MTNEKILEVVERYRTRLADVDPYPYEFGLADRYPSVWCGNSKAKSMLDQIVVFVNEGRIEKAFRWLGFVQGVLWRNGKYSIEDMANYNRQEETA